MFKSRILLHVVNVCLAPWFLTIENNCLCQTSSLPPASAPVMPSSPFARDNELLLVSCVRCKHVLQAASYNWIGVKREKKIIVVTVICFGCHGNCRLSLFMLSCLIQGIGNELNTHARTHARTHTRTHSHTHTHTHIFIEHMTPRMVKLCVEGSNKDILSKVYNLFPGAEIRC